MSRLFHFWLLLGTALSVAAQSSNIDQEELIVFYPTIVATATNGEAWRVELRGCVYELEKRGLLLAGIRESLEFKDVEMSVAEREIFDQRLRLFLVDHERRKKIYVRIGGQTYFAGKSGADGKFSHTVKLSDAEVQNFRRAGAVGDWRIPFSAVLPEGDERQMAGEIFLGEAVGISVISDIDDTIKITQVRDHQATLRNTFLREFQPVPGMAMFYQGLARSNHAIFHYASASPWQLYEPLAAFVQTNGFPGGTFALKDFRWKDKRLLQLFADPEKYKPGIIGPLLRQFPHRRFILVGDSGERDPEIYAALARKYPEQILLILIRDVTDEPAESPRYQNTFQGLPPALWQIFREPFGIKLP